MRVVLCCVEERWQPAGSGAWLMIMIRSVERVPCGLVTQQQIVSVVLRRGDGGHGRYYIF